MLPIGRSMRTCLATAAVACLAACNPTNGLNGPLAFDVENAGAVVDTDGGVPWDAHVYIWGNVADGGTELATVCSEVTPVGPVNSAVVQNLVALNLQGGAAGLSTGTFAVGGDGGPNSATAVVSLGANGDQPDEVWFGVSGSVTLSSMDSSLIVGNFQLSLQPVAGNPDAGSLSGSFAASPCKP